MTNPNYKQYSYSGPVEEFGRCIADKWSATTFAPTAAKAKSNLVYRFKMEAGKIPSAKITLPGKVVVLE